MPIDLGNTHVRVRKLHLSCIFFLLKKNNAINAICRESRRVSQEEGKKVLGLR